jgi:glycosyltransferase involved in cell wall biosynthesis
MAQAALRVAMDSGLRDRLSYNALEWSKQFSWDKTASEFMDIIDGNRGSEPYTVLQKDYYPVPSIAR